jgi:hypothetical protein
VAGSVSGFPPKGEREHALYEPYSPVKFVLGASRAALV